MNGIADSINKKIEKLKESPNTNSSLTQSPALNFQENVGGSAKSRKKFRRRSSFVNGRSLKKHTLDRRDTGKGDICKALLVPIPNISNGNKKHTEIHKKIQSDLPLERQMYDLVNEACKFTRDEVCDAEEGWNAEIETACKYPQNG